MTHPDGTGYERNLHSEPVEQWLKRADQRASETMEGLLDGEDISTLNLDQRSAWSRFVMSLVRRNPEKVASITHVIDAHIQGKLAHLEAIYDEIRSSSDAATFDEYKARRAPIIRDMLKGELLTTMIDSPIVGAAINQMIWGVATLTDLRPSFLTSDRPVVMTNGIKYPTAHIIIPISPRSIFIATNTPLKLRQLQAAIGDGALLRHINDAVAAQAQKFVYFPNDLQLDFVEARLGMFASQRVGVTEPLVFA